MPFKKIFGSLFGVLLICSLGYIYRADLARFYCWSMPYWDWNYAHNKSKIAPYFDEDFYAKTYTNDLKKSGKSPLDHFLQHSGQPLQGDFDPSPYFNVTLYKERLWPCSGNAFVDYVDQENRLNHEGQEIIVYANEQELGRAWMAIEELLRQGHKVILQTTLKNQQELPNLFLVQEKRGLTVIYTPKESPSFYDSPFLNEPDKFEKPYANYADSEAPVRKITHESGKVYYLHQLKRSHRWKDKGLINPCHLNIAKHYEEPLVFSAFKSEQDFQTYYKRRASGFDLMLLNTDINEKNARIIPGYLYAHVEEAEIPVNKEFSVSFLLSLGYKKGAGNFKTRDGLNYRLRKELWEREAEITIPRKFYISNRDAQSYDASYQTRVMPTHSKKWLFGSMFNIAIENSQQEYYFSEKLLDSFIAMSLPIYIGCPNIDQYFDTRGMIIVSSTQELIEVLNTLTPEDYEKRLPYLQENHKRAKAYLKLAHQTLTNFLAQKN